MFFDYKKSVNRTFWVLALINLVTYACFHTLYNLTTETDAEALITAFYYIDLVATRCTDFILPVIIASVTLLLYGKCEGKKWLLFAPILSTSIIFYTFPYYYVYHVEIGFTTEEALLYALLASLVSIITLFAHSLLLFLVAYVYTRLEKKGTDVREAISARTVYTDRLDFKLGAGYLLFLICLCEMVFRIAMEIYETITFFIEVGTSASAEETLTVIFSYVLIIVLFAISVYICDGVLRHKFKHDFYEVIDDGNH